MNADMLLDAFEKIDDAYIIEARERTDANSVEKKGERVRRAFVLAAAIIAALALCGFAAYELGLIDSWWQRPSADPVKTVESAIEGQAEKEYTLVVQIEEVVVDETETQRMGKKALPVTGKGLIYQNEIIPSGIPHNMPESISDRQFLSIYCEISSSAT